MNRQLCSAILSVAAAQTSFFDIGKTYPYIYDQKSTLFLPVPLKVASPATWTVTLTSPPSTIPANHPLYASAGIIRRYFGPDTFFVVDICATSKHSKILNLNDLSQYASGNGEPLLCEDRSVRTFIEMAVAQHSINRLVSHLPITLTTNHKRYCCCLVASTCRSAWGSCSSWRIRRLRHSATGWWFEPV